MVRHAPRYPAVLTTRPAQRLQEAPVYNEGSGSSVWSSRPNVGTHNQSHWHYGPEIGRNGSRSRSACPGFGNHCKWDSADRNREDREGRLVAIVQDLPLLILDVIARTSILVDGSPAAREIVTRSSGQAPIR